ncbi:ExbD/TolR family protein [Ponticoccus sp. (in: a-proteobacteria)]|uniref:ExbD/TolR family protein n=1 Tax=Ponticoccus sp. (in: a-proteobacteria) TaxID=1925025 RepID=UPI003AB48F06
MRKRTRRRRLSMTSLIDVIFLLLLFFMLSSTFSKFAEVDLAAAGSGATPSTDARPMFLSLAPDSLRLNGTDHPLETLAAVLAAEKGETDTPLPVIVALGEGVTAQRLTDVLAILRGQPGLAVTVLGTT